METQEERTQHRKTKCDCKMRKRLFETQDESAQRKETMRECVTKQQQTETEEQGAKRKKTMQECVTKQWQTETEEQGTKRWKTDRDFKRRKCEELRIQLQNDRRDCNGEDMTTVIDHAMKEARKFLHRTCDPETPHKHRAIVCIICDRFIIGMETIHKLTKKDIGSHSERLGSKVTKSTTKPH